MIPAERYWLFEQSPLHFARYVIPRITGAKTLYPEQERLFSTTANEIILHWCRQGSKTTCAAVLEAHGAIFHKQSLGLVISATQRQAGILQKRAVRAIQSVSPHAEQWRLVKKVTVPEDPLDENSRLIRCSVLSLELANGSEIVSLPPHPDTIRGYSPDRITLDEAGRIPDGAYDSIRPMRAIKRGRLCLLSTAAGKRGFFYRECLWLDAEGHPLPKGDDDWWRSSMNADACPGITQDFLRKERLRYPNLAIFEQEYYLRFLEPEGALFTEEQVRAMFVPADKAPVKVIKPPLLIPGEAYKREEEGVQRPQRVVPRIGYG